MELKSLNLQTLNKGAVIELFEDAKKKVLDNIFDINTSAETARTINIKITFKPDQDRTSASVAVDVRTSLAGVMPTRSRIFLEENEMYINDPQQPELDLEVEDQKKEFKKVSGGNA